MPRVVTLLAIGLALLTAANAPAQDKKNDISVSFGNTTEKTIKVYKVDAATKKESLMENGELKPGSAAGVVNNARAGDVLRFKVDGTKVFDYKVEPGFADQSITVNITDYRASLTKKPRAKDVQRGELFLPDIMKLLKN